MVKSALLRLIGRHNDSNIPYGTQAESPNCTPIKFTPIEVDPERVPLARNKNLPQRSNTSAGFVQRVRNSFRFKKRLARDYGLMENQPSPIRQQFSLADGTCQESMQSQNHESPVTSLASDPLIQLISCEESGLSDKETSTSNRENTPCSEPLISFDHSPDGGPIRDTSTDLLLDAYFKTPDGMRKYHRRSKVLLSFRDDYLI
ncbi:uncharacterized protein LOC129581266 [Paramacrobiotus metropolitanus]|uniref:uncharacterized protein LOC129581266 n=1 Tax=Paramacrobiotus metropolitanus TaxID=2943436 RepID=UPI002445BC7D|nr:uncharacterized protein LOC129581266 [Paramacrobiotus metropolitanus]XP_055328219.1 uncharacterized protein LOC129581266 [Paramacrobiotus metropolitanus]